MRTSKYIYLKKGDIIPKGAEGYEPLNQMTRKRGYWFLSGMVGRTIGDWGTADKYRIKKKLVTP